MISASPPPFRDIGMFRRVPVEGVELMARGGAGIVLGVVGDVRWGPISQSQHSASHISQSQSRGSLVSIFLDSIRVFDLKIVDIIG